MSLLLPVGVRFAQDCMELRADSVAADRLLSQVSEAPETQAVFIGAYTTKLAASQLVTKQLYDIGHSPETSYNEDRQAASEIGGLALLLSDIIDDQVDDSSMPLDEKFEYMDAGIECLVEGRQPNKKELPSTVPVDMASAVFDLAGYIHERVAKLGGENQLETVITSLVNDVKQQFLSKDSGEQLLLTKRIGQGCAELASSAVLMTDPETDPVVTRAADGIGAYAQCLDVAYEIDEDLQEGAHTYATLFLSRFGDTSHNRKYVRKQLARTGREAFKYGEREMTTQQDTIYKTMKHLMDLKYKVVQQASNALAVAKKTR